MATPLDIHSLGELVVRQAATRPDAPAIAASGRRPLGYGDLHALMDRAGTALARWGCAPDTRIGIVMPNGPEMATACLAVAAAYTAVPLNPAYTEAEHHSLMRRLGVSRVLVQGDQPRARAASRALGIARHLVWSRRWTT